jgi:hypothetical protein
MGSISFFPTREAARTSAVRFGNARPMLQCYDICARLLKKAQMSLDFARDRERFDRLTAPSRVEGPVERPGGPRRAERDSSRSW